MQAISDAVTTLPREAPGDILVFLSGDREVRDTADVLRGLTLRDTEILPLERSSSEVRRATGTTPA